MISYRITGYLCNERSTRSFPCMRNVSVSSLSSERTLKVALNVVSDDLSVTTEVLGSKILVEEDGEL